MCVSIYQIPLLQVLDKKSNFCNILSLNYWQIDASSETNTDSHMLLRRGEARTEIRGQSSYTGREALLLNFGIFTTSLFLCCDCWQSPVYADAKRELLFSVV